METGRRLRALCEQYDRTIAIDRENHAAALLELREELEDAHAALEAEERDRRELERWKSNHLSRELRLALIQRDSAAWLDELRRLEGGGAEVRWPPVDGLRHPDPIVALVADLSNQNEWLCDALRRLGGAALVEHVNRTERVLCWRELYERHLEALRSSIKT